MPPPLITIGITCFNAAETIERAVISATAQDWPNLEIVVVDDHSRDDSWSKLQNLAANYPVRVIRHEQNRGYPAALNSIVDAASGEFVAIFDDDDDSAKDRLSAQFDRIVRYEECHDVSLVFCYSNRAVVKVRHATPDHIALAIGRRSPEPHGAMVADYLFGVARDPAYVWGMFGSCTLMARRSSFVAVGRFDESFRRCAEWDFAVRAAFLDAHFIAVDRPLITQHKTQSTDKAGDVPLTYALLLRSKYREYLEKQGLYTASTMIARSNFHRFRKRLWKSQGYRMLAYISGPRLVVRRLRERRRQRPQLRQNGA